MLDLELAAQASLALPKRNPSLSCPVDSWAIQPFSVWLLLLAGLSQKHHGNPLDSMVPQVGLDLPAEGWPGHVTTQELV